MDPFSGAVFVFRSRSGTGVKILAYDGQEGARQLFAHELSVLLAGGNPDATEAAPQWRSITPSLAA
jgi:hypothetical protein